MFGYGDSIRGPRIEYAPQQAIRARTQITMIVSDYRASIRECTDMSLPRSQTTGSTPWFDAKISSRTPGENLRIFEERAEVLQ